MLICILTKNVITSCSVTMMLFLHLEVKPLMTLTTVLYLSCALISGHLAMMLMELTKRRYPKKKGIKDECSRLLEASTMKSRRGFAIQRLMNAMRQAHADGWFIVFDTLTLADDRLEAFYDNPNALRDYFRDIGRMVLAAEGR